METSVLVSAVVSILVVTLNNRYAKKSRQEQWQQNREQWMLEKEARDIEEIITTLSSFLKSFSDVGRDVLREDRYLLEQLQNLYEAQLMEEMHQSGMMTQAYGGFPMSIQHECMQALESFLKTEPDQLGLLQETVNSVKPWFEIDARRLSVWFEDSGDSEKILSTIAARFNAIHFEMHWQHKKLNHFASDIYENNEVSGSIQLSPDHLQEIERHKESREELFDDLSDFNFYIAKFQKSLVKRFRPSRMEVIRVSTNDGLLVRCARWLERNLRLLLNLG